MWSAYQDEAFRSGSAFLTITTKRTASVLLARTYAVIVLDCGTLVLDSIIAVVNRRNLKRYLRTIELSVARSAFLLKGDSLITFYAMWQHANIIKQLSEFRPSIR